MPKSAWQHIVDTPAAWIEIKSGRLRGPWEVVAMNGHIQGYLHSERNDFVPIGSVLSAGHVGEKKE